jgi:hypothetical protein
MLGVVSSPVELGTTTQSSVPQKATAEFVVPKSMPNA